MGGNELSLLTGGNLFVLTISKLTSPSLIKVVYNRIKQKRYVFSERFKIKSYMAKRTNLGLNLDKWHDLYFFDHEGSQIEISPLRLMLLLLHHKKFYISSAGKSNCLNNYHNLFDKYAHEMSELIPKILTKR